MDNRTFIQRLAADLGLSQPQAQKLTAEIADVLRTTVMQADTLAIPAFGSFSPEKSDEYVAIKPDGSRILMPPCITLKFNASTMLRKNLNHQNNGAR